MAFAFNRTGYLAAAGNANNLPPGDWALGGWLQVVDCLGDTAVVIAEHDAPAPKLAWRYYEQAYPDSDLRLHHSIEVHDDAGGQRRIDSFQHYAAFSGWWHVLVGQSAGTLRLFVNGQADPNAADGCGPVSLGGAPLVFGRYGKLRLAEWAKWDRALAPNEILALSYGYSPWLFPRSRRWYLPMVRSPADLDGSLLVSQVELAVTPHPRIRPACGPRLGRSRPAAPRAHWPFLVQAGCIRHTGARAGAVRLAGARAGCVRTVG